VPDLPGGFRGIRPPKPPAGERRRQAKAYEGAFEAAFSVLIAVGIGHWADGYFEIAPVGVLSGVVLGFAAMTVRLVRLGTQLGITDENSSRDDSDETDPANESNQSADEPGKTNEATETNDPGGPSGAGGI